MMRGLLLLGLILAGLVTWDRSLQQERADDREASGRLKPLIDLSQHENMVVAAVRVETSQGEDFVYARSRGVWKLIEPAVSTNPYFQFDATVPEAGDFVFTWYDDDGSVYDTTKSVAIG